MTRRRLPALLLLLLACGCTPGAGLQDDPLSLNQQGLDAANADRNEEALALFLQACDAQPDNAVCRSNAGLMAYRLRRFPEAYEHLKRSAALNPAGTVNRSAVPDVTWRAAVQIPVLAAAGAAANAAGVTAYVAKDLPGAERWYRTALEAEPVLPWASWNLACLMAEQGKEAEAGAFLDRWLDYAPAYAPYRAELGLALLKADARNAAFVKEEAAAFDAECAGDWPEAFRRYSRCWALLDPGNDGGWWGYLAGNLVRLRRRIQPPPPMPEPVRRLLVLGEIHAKEKRYAEAAECFQRVINNCPWSNEASSNRALLRAEVGDYVGAAIAMMHYLDYFPDAPDARAAQDQIYAWEAKGAKIAPSTDPWKPWFGMNWKDEGGAIRVLQVAKDSPMDRAGLRPGDELASFRGEPVKDTVSLQPRLQACEPGQEVEIVVRRAGREIPMRVLVAHRAVGAVR